MPPGVRFLWGSFQFDGMMDSLEETLEFFSPDGRPLRASVSLGAVAAEDHRFAFGHGSRRRAGAPRRRAARDAGHRAARRRRPRARRCRALADAAGAAAATGSRSPRANGIENPRRLRPGRLIDLNVRDAERLGGEEVRWPS